MAKLVVHSQALGDEVNMFRWHWLLWAVIGLAVVGLCLLLFWPVGPGNTAGIVVRASRLPVSVKAGDVRMTLDSVTSRGTIDCREVSVLMTVESLKRGRRLLVEDVYVVVNGVRVRSDGSGTSIARKDPQLLRLDCSFTIGTRLRKLDMGFAVQSYIPGAAKKLSFDKIAASALPVTRRAGPMSVTLTQIEYTHGGGIHGYEADKWIANDSVKIAYIQRGPADNFLGEIMMRDGQPDQYCGGPEPYWCVEDGALRDDSGRLLQGTSSSLGESAGARDVFLKQSESRTREESLVALVDQPRSLRMATDRALRAARAAQRVFECDLEFDASRHTKHISWEPVTHLPPVSRKRQMVTFKAIPLPMPAHP